MHFTALIIATLASVVAALPAVDPSLTPAIRISEYKDYKCSPDGLLSPSISIPGDTAVGQTKWTPPKTVSIGYASLAGTKQGCILWLYSNLECTSDLTFVTPIVGPPQCSTPPGNKGWRCVKLVCPS